MKFTCTVNLSSEDLAALAEAEYKPSAFWSRGVLKREHAKPGLQDVCKFVREAVKEKLRGAYVSSGAARQGHLEAWHARGKK